MKILFWIQTFYPANIDFTIRQRCFITLDPEFLPWIKVFTLDPQLSYYSRSKVFTPDPKLLLWIQSYYSGSKVITPDPKFQRILYKLLHRIQSFYSGSKVIIPDPMFLL